LVLAYVNRLSDWLFVMGRWTGLQLQSDEALWVPLGKRAAEHGVAARIRQMQANDDDLASL